MLYSPAFVASLGVRPVAAAPTPKSIVIAPHDPPEFSSLPAAWSPLVTVTGIDRVKWAVFQVSTSNPPQWTSISNFTEVAIPGGSGSFTPNAQMLYPRDRLVVKTLDETIEDVSGPTVLNAPPPSETDGLTMARAFVSDLTVGVNIERGQSIWNDWITTAQLQQYKNQGCSHVRFFANIGSDQNWNVPSASDVANGAMDWLFHACERAMGVGLKVQVDILDVMYDWAMADGRVMPYVRACAQRIASRGWNVTRYALGAANEYGAGTNASHRTKRLEALAILRQELPNSLLVSASANWGNPWTMIDDSYDVGADTRMLHQWHIYHPQGDQLAVAQDIQTHVSAWASRKNVVAFCGEYGFGEPNGSDGGATNYGIFPTVIDAAARGMGQQRPTFWTVTAGAWWRLNEWDSGALRSEIASALGAGNTHIRAQSWFQPITGGGGGGNPTPPANQVTRIQVLHRGQSNAGFAHEFGAPAALRDTFAALAQIPVDMISRYQSGDDGTLHGGTYEFWDSPYNGDPRWLRPPNNDYGSSPSGWASEYPMQQTLNAATRFVSSDQSIPLIDLRLHWEYAMGMDEAAAKAAYRAGAWEITSRLRAARAKAAGKHRAYYLYCPYEGGSWAAFDDVNAAWLADLADASRNVRMGCGNMMDAQRNTQWNPDGDPSHWGDQSGPRIYPRIAFRLAKDAYDLGWLPTGVDLSDCPALGPAIQSASRSGNSINLTVAHDKGSSLVAGQDGIDWAAFTVSDLSGNHVQANGGAITGANTIRVDFGSQPPSGGRIWHCWFPVFRRRRLIRDNWHAARPAKYAGVPNVGVVEFPLQRTMQGVAY